MHNLGHYHSDPGCGYVFSGENYSIGRKKFPSIG